MGKHAVIGNSQVGHKNTSLKLASQNVQAARVRNAPAMAGTLTVRDMTMDEMILAIMRPSTNAPDLTGIAGGANLIPVIKERGTRFRVISGTREELRVANGILVLRKVAKTVQGQKFSAWIGEFVPYGAKTGRVLIAKLIVKGDPPVKSDTRDALLSRALLGR